MSRNGHGKIRGIFFDAGGTLLSTREPAPYIYAKVSYKYGCQASVKEIEVKFLEVWHRRNGLRELQGPLVHKNERKFWREFVEGVFDTFGPLNHFDDFVQELHEIFYDPSTWKVFEDVEPLLGYLSERQISLVVVSNWDSQLPALLNRVGLGSHFSAVLASSIVGSAKPAREIFQAALDHTGFSPEEVCHVGDSPVDDVGGARQVGIRGVLLDRLGVFASEEMPRISSLAELPRILEM